MAAAGSSTPPRRAFGSGGGGGGSGGGTINGGGNPPSRRTSSISSFATVAGSAQHVKAANSSSTTLAPSSQHALATSPSSVTSMPGMTSTTLHGRERSTSNSSASAAVGQWLSALAPRGEGRGREFLSSTLSGVATVASTVGQEVNGFINRPPPGAGGGGHSRPNSFSASSPPGGIEPRARRHSRRDSTTPDGLTLPRTTSPVPALSNGSSATSSVNGAGAGPGSGAGGTGTTNAPPTRRVPQPANVSRLGNSISHQSLASHASHTSLTSPLTSPTQTSFHRPQHAATLPAPAAPARPTSPSALSASGMSASGAGGNSPLVRRGSHARGTSLGGSSLPGNTRVRAAGMPYKIGFQPSGVRADRTAEFMAERRAQGAERDKEEGRLGRRWAKLVDLHFNPSFQTIPGAAAAGTAGNGVTQSSSTNSNSSLVGALDSLNPKEVWRGIKMATGPNPEETRKRAAEQGIVKWEDDADAKKCRICQAGFSLSNRKHHCRLCGRIVCSLPPTPPALLAVQMQLFSPADADAAADPHTLPVTAQQASLPPGTRTEKCSLLLVADWKTGRGEEVDEGFVGWMSLDDANEKRHGGDAAKTIRNSKKRGGAGAHSSAAAAAHARRESRDSSRRVLADSRSGTPLPQQPQEIAVRGVRVCRECWAVVSRKHRIAERERVTPFARLYHALRALQAEIESVLPDFEELLAAERARVGGTGTATTSTATSTTSDGADDVPEPSDELLEQHRILLALLGQYDTVAKRLSQLPCTEGGSQASVQASVAKSAALLLARAMASVHAVPQLQRKAAAAAAARARSKGVVVVETTMGDVLRAEGVRDEAADEVARALQPLLEQQAQLEAFIAEANAQRKYDDSRSLSAALVEIEAEIARLTVTAIQ